MTILPLVSIVIPTYNREKYLKRAIDSALSQTYQNIEIVVIDDGSTDRTFEKIVELSKKEKRIIIRKNKVNLGFVKTLNAGIQSARGKYIARLDDDDVWLDSRKLEKQVGFIEKNSEYVLVGGGVVKTDSNGKEIVRFSLPENDRDIKKSILISNIFAHSAVLFKKESWERAGGYKEEFGFFADWELWLKLGTFGKLYNFQDFFIGYLDHESKKLRSTHDYLMRRKLGLNIALRNNYKNYYSGYKRGLLLSLAGYCYSFMPFRKMLWPIIFWLRNIIFGRTPYRYIKIKKSVHIKHKRPIMDYKIIIKPKKTLALLDMKELWNYRELLYFLSWRDIKLRYKQTIIGIGWAVIQPFLMMVVFSIIFGSIAGVPSDNIPYPIFAYAGLLFWNMFSNSLNNASQSLVSSSNIVQKVYLPRIILPTASIISTLADFFFSFLIFCGILLYFKFTPHLLGLLALVPTISVTLITSFGLGLFLSAFNVKYRDVRYALPFFIQLLLFVTPVIYPISLVSEKYKWILALNPMTGVIETFKSAFLGSSVINWNMLFISIVSSIVLLIFGLWYFLKTEKVFADVI